MPAERRECERKIGSAKELRRVVTQLAADGTSKAVMFWWGGEPELTGPFLPSSTFITSEARKVRYFHLAWSDTSFDNLGRRANEALLRKSAQTVMRHFAKSPKSLHDGSANGGRRVSKVFPTLVTGVEIQVVRWEEWWNAMGGGHAGGTDYVLLINHPPLRTRQ